MDHQLAESKEQEAGQFELFLVINRLEEFASAVNDRLSTVDFNTKREIIRALVKRIEIHKNEIVVVFRVDPDPDPGLQSDEGSANINGGKSFMQDRPRRTRGPSRERRARGPLSPRAIAGNSSAPVSGCIRPSL